MMDLKAFCREMQILPSVQCRLEPVWEKLIHGWDGSLPFFLNQEYFERIYLWCRSPFSLEQIRPYTESVISIARKNPEAALLTHVVFQGAFILNPSFCFDFPPDRLPFFGEKYTGMTGLMISLGAYPLIVKAYAELGVPERYAQNVMQGIGGSMTAFSLAHSGIPGRPCQFGWIRRYIEKTLFRIGRLEYLLHPFTDWMPAVYRGPKGKLAVLCRDGWTFRSDGRRAMPGDVSVHTVHLEENENGCISGIPCYPDGSVDFQHPLTLNTSEWHPAASPWDICPSLHIPAGGRMPFEEVKGSMLEARDFFLRHLHRRVPLFCCWSWILNPVWEALLRESNIVRFRQECFAFPAVSVGPKSGMIFLFGRDDVSPEELPVVNTVQKAYQEAFRRGQIDYGGIFVLTEDLEKLGSKYYRGNFKIEHTEIGQQEIPSESKKKQEKRRENEKLSIFD